MAMSFDNYEYSLMFSSKMADVLGSLITKTKGNEGGERTAASNEARDVVIVESINALQIPPKKSVRSSN